MRRLIFLSILSAVSNALFSQHKVADSLSQIKKIKADTVIAYNFNNKPGGNFSNNHSFFDLVNKEGQLNLSVETPGRILSRKEIDCLIKTVLIPKNYETSFYNAKGCYIPRHGFLFLDKQGTKLAYLDICLECHRITFADLVKGSYYQTSFYEDGTLSLTEMIKFLGLKVNDK